ncbi:hypothetical protein KW507_22180 [Vibrio fluvialis]|nr:hypothetical protein [Vibrio fluvialis]
MPTTYEYNGHKGLKAIAEAYGMSQHTLSNRLNKRKMTMEQAVSAGLFERHGASKAKNVKNKDPEIGRKTEYVAIRRPYLLAPLWRLALGFGGTNG